MTLLATCLPRDILWSWGEFSYMSLVLSLCSDGVHIKCTVPSHTCFTNSQPYKVEQKQFTTHELTHTRSNELVVKRFCFNYKIRDLTSVLCFLLWLSSSYNDTSCCKKVILSNLVNARVDFEDVTEEYERKSSYITFLFTHFHINPATSKTNV